ncbi:unnamed protein product [Adineta steineri]|uniref:Uncharacterized protein n=1 Tax=Adineta steineri TaxID=433720 RepID=A0A818TB35_9BILA|nr:unnamed protein product [Adineta steineri]
MKSKQLNPKSVRPLSTNSTSNSVNKQRARCSLCDSLLKSSTNHRYFLTGKSAHDNLDKDITYGECCKRYLNGVYESDKLQMICLKCCQNLQKINSLYKDAEELKEKIRHTWHKTKRLNRARHSRSTSSRINENESSSPSFPTIATDNNIIISIKKELDVDEVPSEIKVTEEQPSSTISKTVAKSSYDLPNNQSTNKKLNSLSIPHQLSDMNHDRINVPKAKSRIPKQTQPSSKKPTNNSYARKKSHLVTDSPSVLPTQISRSIIPNEQEYYPNYLYSSTNNNPTASTYAQLMIESPSPSSSSSSHQQQPQIEKLRRDSSDSEQQPSSAINYEQSLDGDRSFSPPTNDDEASSTNGSKSTRLSRRQYDFLVKLPDQQSLNAFIETSSAESGSRWTWRRTSANSRGYKVYYVCNFSMRRHYHPCPAAMYALFHPEGSISIYSCGQHQHIPKDRLPVSITDATKDEIFKCLQAGMATTEIREHLTRKQLPFGDTRKLNNFIKYHKELLRFGTVTNVRIGGTAYRQPQCWAIRRQPSAPPSMPAPVTASDNITATTTTTS